MGKENRESAEKSDVKSSGAGSRKVSQIEDEKVGGKSGMRFPIHNHPDKSQVRSKLKE